MVTEIPIESDTGTGSISENFALEAPEIPEAAPSERSSQPECEAEPKS